MAENNASSNTGTTVLPPKKRICRGKSKTGCMTCRVRRIKCDEKKPSCQRCLKSEFVCDGYIKPEPNRKYGFTSSKKVILPKIAHTFTPTSTTLSSPTDCVPSSLPNFLLNKWNCTQSPVSLLGSNDILFDNALQPQYFKIFCSASTAHFGGAGYFDCPIWTQLILDVAQYNSVVRHAMVAVGALFRTHEDNESWPEVPPGAAEEHHKCAVQEYAKSIKCMRQAIATDSYEIRTTLLSCILMICFECLHGNFEGAIATMESGLSLLDEWMKDQFYNSRPVTKRLDKFPNTDFFNSHSQLSPAPHIVENEIVWIFGCLDLQANSFLGERSSKCPQLRQSCNTEIERMPSAFSTVGEARYYLRLIIGEAMSFIAQEKSFELTPVCHSQESKNYCQSPVIFQTIRVYAGATFIERERQQETLHAWESSIDRLQQLAQDHGTSRRDQLLLINFSTVSLLIDIMLSCCLEDEMSYDEYVDDFIKIMRMMKTRFSEWRPYGGFSWDIIQIHILFFIATRCRNRKVRREAVSMLSSKSWRESMWDSQIAANHAKALIEIEEAHLEGDFVPADRRIRASKPILDMESGVGSLQYFLNNDEQMRERRFAC